MLKKFGLITMIIGLLFVMTGCFDIDQPITRDSEGFWNSYFVYPLSWLIIYFGEALNSYGLSIIVVTILLRLLILPLMIKQTKSAKAMQAIQPEMQKLREKYSAKDQKTQQKLQQEMMAMFQERGVNPLAGCLPLFVQMPILLAFYHAIMRTDVIGNYSFLWFELGAPDPFVLPIVAGITTFIQQKMMMVTDNPQMKILLYVMPVMIFVFAMFFPAALTLYWVVGNLVMITQTYFITGPNVGKDKTAEAAAGGKKK
ncbi:Oxa1-like chaperone and sporulation protein (yidC1/spoIIIJ) [Alkalihalophilus pseudofirmus OF4]|uniref:Membrane protein insertase YidC n=1 Tax=Alkalihalophilus pseudofirmus (strain ATCC BAA-2126 / JCM 17055 / OF4) TaxID=398511 RepID=D3FQH4_ALKPO|nr:YidC family membrane integrase SpoIIIJ [Alkalihalophilus pseudofirmus]ADC49646.1 Oxa1-like chaperone and sporulation protein (yidC1/spoIIIJ) [Alkalihalophilus pseudofirmus OF4]